MDCRGEGGERTPRADAQRSRRCLLAAARRALAEDGPDVTLDRVVQRAGVAPATLYRHFPHRTALWQAVLDERLEAVAPALAAAMEDGDALRGLGTALGLLLRLATEERVTLEAAREGDAAMAPFLAHFREPLCALIRRGQSAGEVRTDLGPDALPILVRMIWAMAQMSPGADVARSLLAVVLDGLRARAPTPGA
jgi:AcrR family transcriptional regulator